MKNVVAVMTSVSDVVGPDKPHTTTAASHGRHRPAMILGHGRHWARKGGAKRGQHPFIDPWSRVFCFQCREPPAIPGPGPSDSVGYIGVPNAVTPSTVKRLEKGDR